MKKSISIEYVACTFLIMIVAWGICIVCGQLGVTLEDNKWIYAPYLLGGWSPIISSYIVLKKNGKVANFKEWLENIFFVKQPVRLYTIVFLLCSLYFIPQILVSGLEKMRPIYLIVILTPLMVFGGGLEEAGWRVYTAT